MRCVSRSCARLADHLRHHAADFTVLLHLWGATDPPTARVVRALPEDQAFAENLPTLLRRHGPEALLLSLLLDKRRAALESWQNLQAQADATAEATAQQGEAADDMPATPALATSAAIEEKKRGEELRRARTEAHEARVEAARLRDELNNLRLRTQKESQAATLRLQQQEKQGAAAQAQSETQLQEARTTLDRTARRLKQNEKSVEELAVENKCLKRQLRQGQQLQEELRKRLANADARLRETEGQAQAATHQPREAAQTTAVSPPQTPKNTSAAKPAKPFSSSPLRPVSPFSAVSPPDEPFAWTADGRPFRVTAREVRRAIDCNDEAWVFALIQGLDALRQTKPVLHRALLSRVREFGHYYHRVLTTDTTRVLVDASNVARYETNRRGKGQLRHLLLLRDELRRRDCFPIVLLADASLPYHIDEPDELLAMARRGELEIAPAGTEADEHLAREARRSGAYVVTNDRSFHLKVAPDFEPPRIAFRAHDGVVLVDDF